MKVRELQLKTEGSKRPEKGTKYLKKILKATKKLKIIKKAVEVVTTTTTKL